MSIENYFQQLSHLNRIDLSFLKSYAIYTIIHYFSVRLCLYIIREFSEKYRFSFKKNSVNSVNDNSTDKDNDNDNNESNNSAFLNFQAAAAECTIVK